MKKVAILFILLCVGFTAVMYAAASGTPVQYKINGIQEKALLSNAQKRLAGLPQTAESKEAINTLKTEARDNIQKALEPFGYFKSKITSQLTKNPKKGWLLHYTVSVGKPVRITRVKLTIKGDGRHNPALLKFKRNLPIKVGQVFSVDRYDQVKTKLFNIASRKGYIKTSMVYHHITINLKNNTAQITFVLDTGPRYYFGPVYFKKNPLRTSFLKRYLNFKPGDVYNPNKLAELQQIYGETNYFKSVAVYPFKKHIKKRRIPIGVYATPRKSQEYLFGVGYGTFTGPRASATVNFRRINALGHHARVQLNVSRVISNLAAKYFIPGQDPRTEQYFIGSNLEFQNLPRSNTSQFYNLSAGLNKAYTANLQATYKLVLQRERFQKDGLPYQIDFITMPSINLTYSKKNRLINPTRGEYLSATLRGASKGLASSVSFVQLLLQGKYIYPISRMNRLILRGSFGYTAVSDFPRLPLSLSFYTGGPGSVRGYAYQEFGPGRYLKIFSAEFQQTIKGPFYASVFYDAGNATQHMNTSLEKSVGIALRYNSIVGPIQISLAQTLTAPGNPRRIIFNLGAEL